VSATQPPGSAGAAGTIGGPGGGAGGGAAVLETAGLGPAVPPVVGVARLLAVDPGRQRGGPGRTERAGKTTLLHLATGLLRPTAGAVEVLGRSPRERAARARVGFRRPGQAAVPAR
jgi:hypothetical protein